MNAENNKLIAEFMELRSTNKCIRDEKGKYYDYFANSKFSCIKEQEIQIESKNGFGLVEQDFLFIEDLKFHSDWNWLMEVVEKIKPLQRNGNYNYSRLMNMTLEEALNIDRVYYHVVEFIKWYSVS